MKKKTFLNNQKFYHPISFKKHILHFSSILDKFNEVSKSTSNCSTKMIDIIRYYNFYQVIYLNVNLTSSNAFVLPKAINRNCSVFEFLSNQKFYSFFFYPTLIDVVQKLFEHYMFCKK